MHCSFAVLICCALAAPVLAQSSAAAPATSNVSMPDTAKPVKATKICRETTPTGPQLNAVKQCATAAEWERMYRDSRENLAQKQSGGSHVTSG